jgi:predicted ATP-dependent endonuclease of OLD family
VEVLSRIFGVDSKELQSLYKVKSLGTSLSNHLTSGQKRIFTIFNSVSNSDTKILLIDESEVSLHIDWQRQVIDKVQELSRSSMKLIATHSPDVIYHHHENVIDLPPSDEV